MLTNQFYSEASKASKEVGISLDDIHELLGIDITSKNYPDEEFEIIVPNPKPKEETMKVGLGGQFVPTYWTTTLFSFPAGDQPLDDERLKSSLSQALGLLPALSGRIMTRDGKPYNFIDHRKDLHIKLDNTGVWFSSAQSDENFRFLQKDMFSYEVHEPNYLFSRAQKAVKNKKSPPLLAVKVTHYSCGSALMSFMVSHIINDGRSTHLFMRLWGQLYRGVEINELYDDSLVYKGDTEIFTDRAKSFFDFWSQPFPDDTHEKFSFKTVRYSITKYDMAELKESCNSKYKIGFVSSDDVLCAVVWRTLMKARGFSPDTLSQFQRVLDIRNSKGLDLNSSYGNGIVWFTHSPIKISDLLNMPLHELALTFRTTLQAHNKNYISDFLTAVEHLPFASYALRLNDYHTGPHILSSSYVKFDPLQLEFNVPAALNIRIPYPSGQVHTYCPTHSHYFALVGVAAEHIPQLFKDPELYQWGFKVEVAPFNSDIIN